jgi:hypothetical protein
MTPIPTGVWKKGNGTLTATLSGISILIKPTIGKEFKVSTEDWLTRLVRLQDEGWVNEDQEDTSGVHTSSPPPSPSEPPKIPLHSDTVLRRKGGAIYLMTRKERGWDAYAHRVPSEAWVAIKFNVRLGTWSKDEHGEFCPVTRVSHRMVSKPPRPGDRKTG